MTKKKHLPNSTSFKRGNDLSRKDGSWAVMLRGIEAMDEKQMGYFFALRQSVASHPERVQSRLDLAAMARYLADAFFLRTLKDVANGIDIADSSAGKRAGYHIGLADRILAAMPDDSGGPINVTELLEQSEDDDDRE